MVDHKDLLAKEAEAIDNMLTNGESAVALVERMDRERTRLQTVAEDWVPAIAGVYPECLLWSVCVLAHKLLATQGI